MKNKLIKTVGLLVFGFVCLFGYVASQKPKVWCNHQWAGIALLKGGYRSWTMSFCDGQAFLDGKVQPVVITTNGYRKGYFSWPQFSHVDTRNLRR